MELIHARIDHFSDSLCLSLPLSLGILNNQAAGLPLPTSSCSRPSWLQVAGCSYPAQAVQRNQLLVSGTSLPAPVHDVVVFSAAAAASRVPEVAVATCPYTYPQ